MGDRCSHSLRFLGEISDGRRVDWILITGQKIGCTIGIKAGSAEFVVAFRHFWSQVGWHGGFYEYGQLHPDEDPFSAGEFAIPRPSNRDILIGGAFRLRGTRQLFEPSGEWIYTYRSPFWMLLVLYTFSCGCMHVLASRCLAKRRKQIAQQVEDADAE